MLDLAEEIWISQHNMKTVQSVIVQHTQTHTHKSVFTPLRKFVFWSGAARYDNINEYRQDEDKNPKPRLREKHDNTRTCFHVSFFQERRKHET